jgi:shikimate dehydrogenase
VTVRPRRLVLLGHPVSQSLSPVFQQAALDRAGIALTYEAIDVMPPDLPSLLAQLTRGGAAGNVTVPHKESVAALCAARTPLAERVGAVNTFWVDADGKLQGDNTDVGGFDFAARRLLDRDPAGLTVGVLGAGGAAAAVCEAVREWKGSRVVLHARTRERAQKLAERYAMGSEGSLMPIAPGMIPSHVAVMDLTYRRGRTPWARSCRARGLKADDGLPMLIEQGALAFEKWFGVAPDREAMWASVRS